MEQRIGPVKEEKKVGKLEMLAYIYSDDDSELNYQSSNKTIENEKLRYKEGFEGCETEKEDTRKQRKMI